MLYRIATGSNLVCFSCSMWTITFLSKTRRLLMSGFVLEDDSYEVLEMHDSCFMHFCSFPNCTVLSLNRLTLPKYVWCSNLSVPFCIIYFHLFPKGKKELTFQKFESHIELNIPRMMGILTDSQKIIIRLFMTRG